MRPHLERIDRARGDTVISASTHIEHVWFPESGICSLVLTSNDGRSAEIGIVGREGVVGGAAAFGVDTLPHSSLMQVPGTCLTISAEILRDICDRRPEVNRLISRFQHVLATQAIQTALANANYTVEERLARWLLMCHDRIDGNEIELTHDFLGTMLSVRRSTVTLATHHLEGAGLIRAQRGRITIVQREKLQRLTGGAYGMPEVEYERIIGPFRQSGQAARC
ncbi:Crp/Fnr family transcriptional regulator [Fulvimarina sp. 2208YS6-2-32]|uniref:Crp/Fnr family transcriptional regulator n=1 Tax=Fulvimarina uroteuthidis TaxID=3098149 RepID=A0ABU5HXW4_9HYPH|nr:Crp/Fnr family transcriptional regulator [Fulvimarina sp. 2208YS6-2-32]MDY8107985.1 Crp/Fnr family transcriptional regulator [Fulvimarina sp. 2208YS6-2-32]